MINGTGSLLNAGYTGIQTGLRQATEAAQTVARAGSAGNPTSSDLETAAVEMLRSEQVVQSSSEAVKVANEMLGTIIDTRA